MAGLPGYTDDVYASAVQQMSTPTPVPLEPVSLRPLNLPGDNLFASHRSHSSHGSHRSHSSGSGGGYVAPRQTPTPPTYPSPSPGSSNSLRGGTTNQPTDAGRPATVSPEVKQTKPNLSLSEKRKLQIMRVQLALTGLGIYKGPVDGILNAETASSLKLFQNVKGLKEDGMMNTDTLNALGVPAVQ